jgi:hypothetical protein
MSWTIQRVVVPCHRSPLGVFSAGKEVRDHGRDHDQRVSFKSSVTRADHSPIIALTLGVVAVDVTIVRDGTWRASDRG